MIADDTTISTIGLVLTAVITVGGSVAVAIIARKANVVEKKVDSNADALDAVHTLVNNNLDVVMDKNTDLAERNTGLREELRVAKTQPAENSE